MVFSSLTFLYIFLLFAILSYSLTRQNRSRNSLLLGFSLFFYAWGEPVWIFLMIFDAFAAWLCSIGIHRLYEKARQRLPILEALGQNDKTFLSASRTLPEGESLDSDADLFLKKIRFQARLLLILAVTFCLSLLLIFKYTGFFVDALNLLPFVKIPRPGIRLPIGISFFTFQIITYVADVYRRDAKVQKNFADLLLYVSLFPQLIAGPIVRYADVAEQINRRLVTSEKLVAGIERFLIGLAKKCLIANYAGSLVRDTLETRLAQSSSLELLIGLLAYALQIYFDFSAYSDMAIGLGRMFGFEFLENFNYPYISKSVTEFWRRWHMSLGTFFRDYVYIPLGGRYRHQLRNILVVWLLTGFWHGASLNFILWGLYYALLLIFEKYFFHRVSEHWPDFLRRLLTFSAVLLGWVFFYFLDFGKMGLFFKLLFAPGANGYSSVIALATLKSNLIFFAAAFFAATPLPRRLYKSAMRALWSRFGGIYDPRKHCLEKRADRRFGYSIELPERQVQGTWMMNVTLVLTLLQNSLLLFLSTASLISASYNPFLYFRF